MEVEFVVGGMLLEFVSLEVAQLFSVSVYVRVRVWGLGLQKFIRRGVVKLFCVWGWVHDEGVRGAGGWV